MKRVAALLLLAACAQDSGTVMGVVTEVEGDLTAVQGFTLLVEGEAMSFVPEPDGEFDYPLTHLREHLLDGTPIRVTWERQGNRNLAIAVGDP